MIPPGRVRRLLAAGFLGLIVHTAGRAEQPAKAAERPLAEWAKRSNANAKLMLELLAKLQPEAAVEFGVEGYDDQISDLSPGFVGRELKASRQVHAELVRRLAVESEPRVKQDLEILVKAAADIIKGTELTEKLSVRLDRRAGRFRRTGHVRVQQHQCRGLGIIRRVVDRAVRARGRAADLPSTSPCAGSEGVSGHRAANWQDHARAAHWRLSRMTSWSRTGWPTRRSSDTPSAHPARLMPISTVTLACESCAPRLRRSWAAASSPRPFTTSSSHRGCCRPDCFGRQCSRNL